MAVEPTLMTAEDLWRLPDDGMRHELVRGELRTMPPGGYEHGLRTSILDRSLGNHVEEHDLGDVLTNEPGFRLASDPDTVRAPDVAFVSRARADAAGDVTRFWAGAPDLAIEVISPGDLYTEVEEKVAEYLEAGTRMVLVVNPRRRTVAVHRPNRPPRILTIDDAIDGEDVVPGWTLPLRRLFADRPRRS
jgi:Uma2 family endonuclease